MKNVIWEFRTEDELSNLLYISHEEINVEREVILRVGRIGCCDEYENDTSDAIWMMNAGQLAQDFNRWYPHGSCNRPNWDTVNTILEPQAGFFSGAKRSCTCPPAAGRFPFGREAPVYLPTARRPVYFRVRSACVPAHRPQAGFLSGAKRPCPCPPAAGRFPFGREAPVYMPIGRPQELAAKRLVLYMTWVTWKRGKVMNIIDR